MRWIDRMRRAAASRVTPIASRFFTLVALQFILAFGAANFEVELKLESAHVLAQRARFRALIAGAARGHHDGAAQLRHLRESRTEQFELELIGGALETR